MKRRRTGRSTRSRIPHQVTSTMASTTIRPDIFEVPRSRSLNEIGTSTIFPPALRPRRSSRSESRSRRPARRRGRSPSTPSPGRRDSRRSSRTHRASGAPPRIDCPTGTADGGGAAIAGWSRRGHTATRSRGRPRRRSPRGAKEARRGRATSRSPSRSSRRVHARARCGSRRGTPTRAPLFPDDARRRSASAGRPAAPRARRCRRGCRRRRRGSPRRAPRPAPCRAPPRC